MIVDTSHIQIGSRSYDRLAGVSQYAIVSVVVCGLPIRSLWRLVAVFKARVLLEARLLASYNTSKHATFTRCRNLVFVCSVRAVRSL